MLITASIIRADGTEGEVTQQAFGFDHLIGIGRIALDDLTDVALTNPIADEVLTFNGSEWVNESGGGGGAVNSVFGRTGAVVAVSGDYTSATVPDSSNKRYVTDAELVVLGNTSGTNTGDQIISDATISTSDITTNNSSTAKHGFLKKLSNVVTQFMDGTGNWSTPTGTAPGGTSGQVQYNNSSTFGGFTVSGDGTLNTGTGALTVTKTNGVALGTLATQNGIFSGTSSGTNTGDQTSIVGITGTLSEFNTALTGADFASGGGTITGASSGTNTGDQTTIVGITGTLAQFNTALTGADFASGGGTVSGSSSGTNTGDQTSIVGITGTLSEFNTALTGADFASGGGTVTGTSSGTNTGDQTTVSGNAGTATALQNARTIGGVSFDGTANIVPQTIQSVNEATDTTCFPLFISASGSQSLQPLNNAGLIYNSNTNALTATTFVGAVNGNVSTATALATARAIYGNNFDGTAALNQIIASTYGGTGNGFTKISGPTTAERTKTMRDANDTVLELGGSYTPTGTFTSLTMVTPVLGTPTSGNLANCTALPISGLTASTSTAIGVGSIELGAAADTTITRSGAGAIQVEGVQVLLSGAALGTPSSGTLSSCTAATDSTAGVMSAADHTTLTSLSAATATGVAPAFVGVGIPVVAFKSGVDLKNAATVDIFTVPASRTFVTTGYVAQVTSVTSGGAGTFSANLKESSASKAMMQTAATGSSTPVANQTVFVFLTATTQMWSNCAAGNKVQLSVATSNAGSTAVSGSVWVFGIYAT